MARLLPIRLAVNGAERTATVPARRLLCDFLRDDLGLTGTHVGCSVGTCGSCTVAVDGRTVRSCLMLAVQADGAEVRTVESLGTEADLHPVQRAFHEHHALQCGFCTPGLLMSLATLLGHRPAASDQELIAVVGGHLCRCTGYRNILEAARAAAREARERTAVAP
jgi:carbon-monoxide dehydrogenase small subunit